MILFISLLLWVPRHLTGLALLIWGWSNLMKSKHAKKETGFFLRSKFEGKLNLVTVGRDSSFPCLGVCVSFRVGSCVWGSYFDTFHNSWLFSLRRWHVGALCLYKAVCLNKHRTLSARDRSRAVDFLWRLVTHCLGLPNYCKTSEKTQQRTWHVLQVSSESALTPLSK